jgi:hypothetical protein
MRFVLTYDGLLPSSGDPSDKHNVRVQIHPQLKRQWEVDGCLASIVNAKPPPPPEPNELGITKLLRRMTELEKPIKLQRGLFCFVPLVTKRLNLTCFLDITFLRPEEPGQLIRHGGDIDNRIKTLLDSLRVPDENEVSKFSPEPGQDPFYCLLEDDCLVTGLQVKTERLLVPPKPTPVSEVRLVIAVTVRPTEINLLNTPFLGEWP